MEGERSPDIFFLSLFAGVTIEASLAITFFLIFFLSIVSLFFVMDLQLRVQKTLEQLSDETVKVCCLSLPDQDLITQEILRIRFLALMEESGEGSGNPILERGLLSGDAGRISFSKSEINPDSGRIMLAVTYPAALPMVNWSMETFTVTQYSYRYGWIGDGEGGEKESGTGDQTVYVTADSQVYHLSADCTHLRLSIRTVPMAEIWSLKNSDGRKYTACELCKPKTTETYVYITEHGDRYHGEMNCSGLKRSFQAIPLAEVGDRRLCSRCAEKTETEKASAKEK